MQPFPLDQCHAFNENNSAPPPYTQCLARMRKSIEQFSFTVFYCCQKRVGADLGGGGAFQNVTNHSRKLLEAVYKRSVCSCIFILT